MAHSGISTSPPRKKPGPKRKRKVPNPVGRPKGSQNKRTVAAKLRQSWDKSEQTGVKLGLQVLEDGVQIFGGLLVKLATELSKATTDKQRAAKLPALKEVGDMAHKFAVAAAPYQSPKLNPIDDPNLPQRSDRDDEGTATISIKLKDSRGRTQATIIDGRVQGPDYEDEDDALED